MILNIDQEINSELVEIFVNAYNKQELTSDGSPEKLTVYLRSNGGENDCTSAILHMINNNKDITNIVGYGGLLSNGFRLFFEAECKKQILHDCYGMFHLTRADGNIYEGLSAPIKAHEVFRMKSMNSLYYQEKINKYVKFTKAELKAMQQGHDVYFDEFRMKEMIEFNKKALNI